MNKSDEYLLCELISIKNRFEVVISELQKKDGVIDTQLLNLVDSINALSVMI
jgi:hypothetical protein